MKKKDRYKLLLYAKDQYSKDFNRDYEFKHLSKNTLHKLLKQHKHSCMTAWSYCCCGLYQNCWQEPYFAGNLDIFQERVDNEIRYVIDKTAKICRKDSRILYCESRQEVNVVIVARDILENDYLITFTNEEME